MAIFGAIDKKKVPERPTELLTTDDRANQLWRLLAECWDHNPAARPEAWCILNYLQDLPHDLT
ncbi:hypothetical protein BDV93DRAFT_566258 [Ceratobasidium sp. AG-I]|nr:hypothetical protein BDV93DRAFT_566258 [Ceratobasidium sp. AG-I]